MSGFGDWLKGAASTLAGGGGGGPQVIGGGYQSGPSMGGGVQGGGPSTFNPPMMPGGYGGTNFGMSLPNAYGISSDPTAGSSWGVGGYNPYAGQGGFWGGNGSDIVRLGLGAAGGVLSWWEKRAERKAREQAAKDALEEQKREYDLSREDRQRERTNFANGFANAMAALYG